MRMIKLFFIDFKILLRRKEVVFWNIIFPPMLLIIAGLFTLNSNLMGGAYMNFLTPGLIGYSIMQGSLTGAPLRIVQYSQKGFLTRIYLTPCTINKFIILEFTVTSVLIFFQSFLILIISKFLFHVTVKSLLSFIIGIILGLIIFQMLGIIIATLCRTSEGADAFANCISFPMLIFSGVFFPTSMLPISNTFSPLLPLTPIINIIRKGFNFNMESSVVIVCWIIVLIGGVFITRKIQRR